MIQSEVLEHSTRRRIYDHIVKDPGITFQMLRSVLDMNDGTLKYHLNCLRKNDLIDIRKRKNEKVLIPKNIASDLHTRELRKDQKRILRFVKDHPGSSLKQISSRTGMDRKDVKRTITSLRRKRLVKCRREGNEHLYHSINDEGLYNEIMLVLMNRYLNGEITIDRLKQLKSRLEELKH
jgi:predicted transcriptional regulator